MILVAALFLPPWPAVGQTQDWPVLKRYDQNHLSQIALPLGGIGTGTVSLGGRGELRDWEIMNKPGKGFSTVATGNDAPFFALYVKSSGAAPVTRALIGPLRPEEYQHYEGRPANNHGLPRFAHASFAAAYPFGQVSLSDPGLPVSVKIKGFNPLIPGNADDSSVPIAVLRYEVANLSDSPIEASVCGTMRNFIGQDGSRTKKNWKGDVVPFGAKENQNDFRESGSVKGLFMSSRGVPTEDSAWGTVALTTPESGRITYRRSSTPNDWENAILDFWDDFSADGLLTDKEKIVDDNPMASLAVMKSIPGRSVATFTFYLAWHFPNRRDWNGAWDFGYIGKIVGNYYTTKYRDAWDVIEKEAPRLPDLERKTIAFVEAFVGSDLPEAVKEAALFNLSTLRSQTVFRLPSSHLMGWEGVMDEVGSCFGNCTHVWNYENALPFLFGDLARTMRDVELTYGTKASGKMINRVHLPLESNFTYDHVAAADGQMGAVIRFYREWQHSGDMSWLQKYWPRVKAAMSYAWIENGWDADQDGVEEGEQLNTMDVNYYGPNPQMQFWYFGALKASEKMARAMGDEAFAAKCRRIFEAGSRWVDGNLFNGEYYEHKITDPKTRAFLDMSNPAVEIPPFQLGSGCLVDQLAGQYLAHVCGLGYLAKPENIRTALQSVLKYNSVERFGERFNNMRSYVLGDEAGLVMAGWPKGRLKVPFPYFAESMTGFEYTAAIGMLYEERIDDGLKCIENIRKRFDGEKRNPFDEPECGHHYARAMASWAAVPALTGFLYSGVDQSMTFTARPGRYFWSNGYAWGTVRIESGKATIRVLSGALTLKTFSLKNKAAIKLKDFSLSEGQEREVLF